MSRIICFLLLGLTMTQWTLGQGPEDTTAIIKELDRVMTFSVQPYVHYRAVISMRADQPGDAAMGENTLHNEFYKVQDDLYYGNEQEEIFFQDSLMIRVSHSRRTIQLSMVDIKTKKNVDIMPLKKADMQRMMRERCLISKQADKGDTGNILIRSLEKQMPQGAVSSEIRVQYKLNSHLPTLMEVIIHVRQGDNPAMTQTASVNFGEIETTKERALQMPLWTMEVAYNDQTNNFIGKGRCEGYEVIKTF